MATDTQYRVAVRDGLVLSVKYGIAVLLAGVVYGALAGATWLVRDYLEMRQNARNGQQAAIYLVQRQQEQASVNQQQEQANGQGNALEGADARSQGEAGEAGEGDSAPEAAQAGANR